MIGTRKQRASVAYCIVKSGAANALGLFGEQPECGYFEEIEGLDYHLAAAITADLLKNLPGDWDTRIPDPAASAASPEGTRP